MPFLARPGFRLHYEFEADSARPVLVFANSLGTQLSMWEQQMPAFREHFSVLRYDSRGHGESIEENTDAYSFDELGADLLALLDSLGFDRVHFCGLSMGGMLGQWLGIHAPHRIRKLVLCNTAAKIGTDEGWNTRIDTVRMEGIDAIVPAVLARWFTEDFRAAYPAEFAATAAMLLANRPRGYTASCAAIRDADFRDGIARITAPALIVCGVEDQVTTPAAAAFLAQHIPGARLLALPAAHLSNVEAATAFSTGVLNFFVAGGTDA